jgi:hypothetical protein
MKKIGLLINAYEEVLVVQNTKGICSFPKVEKREHKLTLFGVELTLDEIPYNITDTSENYLAKIVSGKPKYEGAGRIYWMPVDLFSDVEWDEEDESTRLVLQKEGLDKNL